MVQYGIDTLRLGLPVVLPQTDGAVIPVVHQVEQAGIGTAGRAIRSGCQAAGMCQVGYGGFAAARVSRARPCRCFSSAVAGQQARVTRNSRFVGRRLFASSGKGGDASGVDVVPRHEHHFASCRDGDIESEVAQARSARLLQMGMFSVDPAEHLPERRCGRTVQVELGRRCTVPSVPVAVIGAEIADTVRTCLTRLMGLCVWKTEMGGCPP